MDRVAIATDLQDIATDGSIQLGNTYATQYDWSIACSTLALKAFDIALNERSIEYDSPMYQYIFKVHSGVVKIK